MAAVAGVWVVVGASGRSDRNGASREDMRVGVIDYSLDRPLNMNGYVSAHLPWRAPQKQNRDKHGAVHTALKPN